MATVVKWAMHENYALMPTPFVAEFCGPSMSPNALYLLRRNITALLLARKESQQSLAFSLGHHKTWLNKFLNGDREIQFKDLDKIADFFGISAYQLFQPGIADLTERRSGKDRRSGRERRIGHTGRAFLRVDAAVGTAHPRRDTITLTGTELQLIEHLRQQPPDATERVLGLISGIREKKASRKKLVSG